MRALWRSESRNEHVVTPGRKLAEGGDNSLEKVGKKKKIWAVRH